MKNEKLLKISFAVAFGVFVLVSLLKILHYTAAGILYFIGAVAVLTFIIISLREIFASQKIKMHEKIMWTVGLIFVSVITSIVYLFAGRKRVV